MTDEQIAQRLRDAAPPVEDGTRSVWPAVQERLRPRTRSRVRPLLWAGAGLVGAACAVAGLISSPLPHSVAPQVMPPVPVPVAVMPPVPAVRHVKHAVRHKETLAARTVRPRPSHIAYTRPVDAAPPTQTPVPDKDADTTPRLRPASAVPRPHDVKPVE